MDQKVDQIELIRRAQYGDKQCLEQLAGQAICSSRFSPQHCEQIMSSRAGQRRLPLRSPQYAHRAMREQ